MDSQFSTNPEISANLCQRPQTRILPWRFAEMVFLASAQASMRISEIRPSENILLPRIHISFLKGGSRFCYGKGLKLMGEKRWEAAETAPMMRGLKRRIGYFDMFP